MTALLLAAALAAGGWAGPAALSPGDGCPEPSMEALLAAAGRRGAPEELKQSLLSYHACRAAADGSPAGCSALGALRFGGPDADETLESFCREHYYHAAFARAYLDGSAEAAKSVCVEAGEFVVYLGELGCLPEAEFRSPEFHRRLCGLVVDKLGDKKALRAGILSLCRTRPNPAEADELLRDLVLYTGRQPCGGEPADVADCRAFAAYRLARRSGDPAACGAHPLCRAWLGAGGSACEPFAAEARARHCRDSKPGVPPKTR